MEVQDEIPIQVETVVREDVLRGGSVKSTE